MAMDDADKLAPGFRLAPGAGAEMCFGFASGSGGSGGQAG